MMQTGNSGSSLASMLDGDAPQDDCEKRIMLVCSKLWRDCLMWLLTGCGKVFTEGGSTIADAMAQLNSGETTDLVVVVLTGEDAVAEATRGIGPARRRFPATRWLLLSDTVSPRGLQLAAAAGVDALLGHEITPRVLRHAAELLLLGQTLLPASLTRMNEPIRAEPPPLPPIRATDYRPALCRPAIPIEPAETLELAPLGQVHLSERERQIWICLAKGLSNKLIARQLNIADATVKVHVKALLRKLGVTNRTQAAVLALNGNGAEASRA